MDTTRARISAKQIQIIPNKSRQKSLDFLGFIWPIWVFSTGHGGKNKKFRSGSARAAGCGRAAATFRPPRGGWRGERSSDKRNK
jgi:hypothetical protein